MLVEHAPSSNAAYEKKKKAHSREPKIKRRPTLTSGPSKPRQRPTLPQRGPCSTIGPGELNFRVRDGNGCGLARIAAGKKRSKHEVGQSALSLRSCQSGMVDIQGTW